MDPNAVLDFTEQNQIHFVNPKAASLIDFGDSIFIEEKEDLKLFIKMVLPEYYNKNKEKIDLLCDVSVIDIAIASTLLDLYFYLSNCIIIPGLDKEYITEMQDYIFNEYDRYINPSIINKIEQGGSSYLDLQANTISHLNLQSKFDFSKRNHSEIKKLDEIEYLENHKSVFSLEYITGGIQNLDLEGGVEFLFDESNLKNITEFSFRQNKKVLPIWRFMEYFFRNELNKTEKSN